LDRDRLIDPETPDASGQGDVPSYLFDPEIIPIAIRTV